MALLLFFTAFVLSGIAAYYSVIGLIAIFSAAAIPVAIMGGSLEAAKLVVASWLYRYWKSIPFLMKAYFTSALVILMIITSMGIFGFLSKAHSDQSLVSGDVQSRIAMYDEKIKTSKDNIDANRKALKQLDEAVDQVMARSSSETGADKAVAIRRAQQKERSRLLSEIAAEQKTITQLSEERAPIAAEVRKVEAEVGPLKYIAAMIYGDNPDENSLERSVRWLIILLIAVFDPLAVLMLIAANLTQIKQKRVENKEQVEEVTVTEEQVDDKQEESQVEQVKESKDPHPIGWMFDKDRVVKNPPQEEEKSILEQHPYLTKHFDHFENLTPMVYKPEKQMEEVNHEDMATDKIIPDQSVMPMGIEASAGAPEVNRQDAITGFTPAPAMETVGIEQPVKKKRNSKKKPEVEQIAEDKSVSQSIEEQVNTLIANDDTTGLESIYKQIVKELAKNNRNKSTHWGPLKNKKMTDETQHYYITPPTLFLPPSGLRISLIGVDEDWVDELGDSLEDTLPSIPMTFYHLDTATADQWQWQFHMMEQSNLIVVNVARSLTIDLLLSFLHMGDSKIWFYVNPEEVDKNLMTLLNTINANVFADHNEFHSMLTAFIGNV